MAFIRNLFRSPSSTRSSSPSTGRLTPVDPSIDIRIHDPMGPPPSPRYAPYINIDPNSPTSRSPTIRPSSRASFPTQFPSPVSTRSSSPSTARFTPPTPPPGSPRRPVPLRAPSPLPPRYPQMRAGTIGF